jgi:hypothetical protein
VKRLSFVSLLRVTLICQLTFFLTRFSALICYGCTLRFLKHDEGINVRAHDLDREVWLMLMMFPNDARNNTAIFSTSVTGMIPLRRLEWSARF